jgi:hypothetical protein
VEKARGDAIEKDVQQALASFRASQRQDESLMPSQVTDSYWIFADGERGRYPAHTARGGKWLVFLKRDYIDEYWLKIRDAVRDGRLGSSAKCSTAMPNPNASSSSHVICVYTYDAEDAQDVRRVRAALRKLGVIQKIPYKSDAATDQGLYNVHGDTRISSYYE